MSNIQVAASLLEAVDVTEAQVGRRCAPRVSVRAPAQLRIGEVTAEVVVTDISETGARLHLPGPPPVGKKAVLCWQGNESPACVVWASRQSCGIIFEATNPAFRELARLADDAPTRTLPAVPLTLTAEPQPWLTQPSSLQRRPLERPAEVRQGDVWTKVVLRNISQHGFEIGWFPRCREQAPISLRGPGLPVLHGRVVASDRVLVKCKLRTPLHDAVLQHISEQLGIVG
jgi:hypothetical protein